MKKYTDKTDQKDLGIMRKTFFHFYRNHVLVNTKGKKIALIRPHSWELESRWCHIGYSIELFSANIKSSAAGGPIQEQEIKDEIDKYS